MLPPQLSAVTVPGAARVRHLDESEVSNAAAGLNNPRSAHTRTLQATHFPRATPLPLLQGPARQMIQVLSQSNYRWKGPLGISAEASAAS